MPVRASMAAIIARVRLKIFDPAGSGQVFTDNDIQNVLDESRTDLYNQPLEPQWTYSGSTPVVLDYLAPDELGDWEDDIVLKQYLTVVVTPSAIDDIVGHYTFAQSTLPPVFITGKTYDIYRAAADLLEIRASTYALRFNATADGQTLHLEGISTNLLNLAAKYRTKQRVTTLSFTRSDLNGSGAANVGLGPTAIDYMAKG